MKPLFTKQFIRDYQVLSPDIQKKFSKQLELLLSNPRHPSLEARIVDTKRRIWKAKIDSGCRFTFEVRRDLIILRRLGGHNEMERPAHW